MYPVQHDHSVAISPSAAAPCYSRAVSGVTRVVLACALATAACAGTLPDGVRRPLHHADRILLGTAVLSLACDWGSTRRAAKDHWKYGREANPIMGQMPSVGRVDAYMATAAIGTVVLGLVLPEGARTVFLGAVTAVELDLVVFNYHTVPGVCGLPDNPVR